MKFVPAMALLVLASCSPPLPYRFVDGTHVRYHYWADQGAPCAAAIGEMDAFIAGLAAKVGEPLPRGFRVDYYRLRDAAEVGQFCPGRFEACTDGRRVFTRRLTTDHELTHAVLNSLGQPPTLFAEGVAVSFGCGRARWVGEPLEPVDLAVFIDNQAWPARSTEATYESAGSFVHGLIARHGLSSFISFSKATPATASREQVDASFRAAFNEELSDALAQWAAQPHRLGESCEPLDDLCEHAGQLIAPANTSFEVSCVSQVTSLEVPATSQATRLRFTADQEGRSLLIRPCTAAQSESQELAFAYQNIGSTLAMSGKWTELWATLKPGRYSLITVRRDAFEQETPIGGNARIEVSEQQAPFGGDCSVPVVPLADDTWTLALFDDRSPQNGVAVIAPRTNRQLAGFFGSGFDGVARVCTGCGSSASGCRDLAAGSTERDTIQAPTSLSVSRAGAAGVFVKLVLE